MDSTIASVDSPSACESESAPSPIAQLYQNVLGCVFGFLPLRALCDIIVVCRAWKEAVATMASIHAAVSVPPLMPLETLAESATLGRHVGRFEAHKDSALMRIHSSTLAVLADRMPQLQSLGCNVFPALEAELSFPRGLRDLSVAFPSSISVRGVHASLLGMSRLPRLAHLTLELYAPILGLDLQPLASMGALRRLAIHRGRIPVGTWTPAQIAVFRSLSSLEYFCLDDLADCLAALVRQPHDLGWTQIANGRSDKLTVTASMAALLPALPSLSALSLVVSDTPLEFLNQLPRLRSLALQFEYPRRLTLESLRESLSACAGLTSLNIDDSNADGPFFEQLLPLLPKLESLSLSQLPKLSSLEFVRHPTVAASLRSLSLSRGALQPQQLLHLSALKRLEKLSVHQDALKVAPSPELLRQLQPPSELIPSLVVFQWI